MTTTHPTPLFGQAVGEAQRALRAVIDDVLDEAGTTFETWVVLNSLAAQDGSMPETTLRRDLEYGLNTDSATISRLLDQLQSSELIQRGQ